MAKVHRPSFMRFRSLLVGAVALAGVAIPLVTAAPASAGDCTGLRMACIYFNSSSSGYGAYYRHQDDVSDYGSVLFRAGDMGSSGAGVVVKNNGAAIENASLYSFRVYFNSGYNCSVDCQTFAASSGFSNFKAGIKNDNASGKYLR